MFWWLFEIGKYEFVLLLHVNGYELVIQYPPRLITTVYFGKIRSQKIQI